MAPPADANVKIGNDRREFTVRILSAAAACVALSMLAPRPATAQFYVSTLAGSSGSAGSANGTGTVAKFSSPWGVALDSSGTVYVADSGNIAVRKVTRGGAATTFATLFVNSSPAGVAVDSTGTVYVADYGNSVIEKITPAGSVSTLAGLTGVSGYTNGSGTAARFSNPFGIAVDSSGTVHVADTFNNAIRKITPAGNVTTLAGTTAFGANDGAGNVATFSYPGALAVDSSGTVFVADTGNGLIRKITPAGFVSTIATAACSGIALGASGAVYVADGGASILSILPDGTVTTAAGTGANGAADGPAASASFNNPHGVCRDASGNLFVGDYDNQTIRQVSPPAMIQISAGGKFFGTNIYCSLINGGLVAPAGTNATGALSLPPVSYQQLTNGALQIQLGGTNAAASTNGYDQLNSYGAVQLSGSLVVSNFGGFAPRTGNVFSVISGGSLTGSFTSTSLPALSSGALWSVVYGTTGVALQVGFLNNGVVNPSGTNTTGTQSYAPFFAQSASGVLQIELAGINAGLSANGYDRLVSAGEAQLGGTLSVSLFDNFIPQPGQCFTIIVASVVSGRFAATNLPALPDGVGMLLVQTTNRVFLQAGVLNDSFTNPAGANITGTLTAGNFYSQTADGTLQIEVGGTAPGASANGYDQLISPGPVQMAGSLTVTNINGFTEQIGQSFTIITGATVAGSFSATNLPPLSAGAAWSFTNTGFAVTLSVTTAPPATSYSAWAAAITNTFTNYNDSATGDGYPNLLKYATGSSPTAPDTRARMGAGFTNGQLALVFNRNTNALDVSLVVEGAFAATNDANWNGIVTNTGGIWGSAPGVTVTEPGGTNPVPVSVTDGLSAGTNRFLRLRVTMP